MKIAVISPNATHLASSTRVLQARGHTVVAVEGGKTRMRTVAEHEQPDLMLVDGMCCDATEAVPVEYVTSHFPQMAVILMCATQTPEFLINSMRAGVREVLPSPAPADALEAAVARVESKLRGLPARQPGKVLAFLPCKGGSGATFLATNLAYLLAENNSVLLIDLNLQFGDALSFVHDGRPACTLADVAASLERLDGSLLAASAVKVSDNLHVLAAPDDPGQALEIQAEHVESILTTAARHFDFVVLDLSRRLDTCSIKALDRAARIYAVLQPTLPGIRHAAKLRQAFLSLDYAPQKVQFVVNACRRGAEIGPAEVHRALGGTQVLALGEAADDVTASINRGEPLVKAARSHPLARQIIELARQLDPQPEEQPKGLLERVFRRAA